MKGRETMKKLAAIITAITLVAAGINFTPKKVEASVTSSQGSSSWSLVWSDEFNQTSGSTVNSNYWQFDIGTGNWGWGNAELQYYTNSTENVRVLDVDGAVDGKALAITAKRSNGSITSGRIKSLDKQYVKYGRVEARIRTSNGMQPGVWPAFWMMGNDINSSGWPNCGEIDIMEHRNTEAQVISSLHWNPNANGAYAHSFYGSESNGQYGFINSMDDWHTYALEWYEDCMKFYLDGNCYETITLTSEMAEEFHKPHYILLNLAIGSTSSVFTKYITVTDSWSESTMYVDYVRLYQGSDSSFYRALSSDTSGIVTTASPTAGMTACDGSGNWISAGSVWDYSIGTSWSGASAYYTGGSQNDFTIYMSSASTQDWGAMIRANHSVTAGHTYNYSINYTSTAAGSLLVKEDVSSTGEQTVGINKGSGTITGSFTAGDSQSTAQLLMDLRGISTGTKLSITGLTLTDTTSGSTVTTTAAPSVNNGYTDCVNNENVYLGAWGYYVGNSWAYATAKYSGGTSLNDFALKITNGSADEWGVQAFTHPIAVEVGSTYNVSITLNSDTAGAPVLFKDDTSDTVFETKTLVAGNNVYTTTFTPTDDNAKFVFDLGAVTTGTTVKVTSFSLTKTSTAQTTTAAKETTAAQATTTAKPAETTAAQVTTTAKPVETTAAQATTTAKPVETTTVAPVTQKPTGSQVTTAAPTTQKAAVVKVKKSKVKKATKKKSAKKIKLSLKKVKGAKYQIQISKAKKFKKKNILVKKNVKKAKVTIKSKKITNKKKLYVRVRAYKVVNGKKYYSKWSKAKKAKIK